MSKTKNKQISPLHSFVNRRVVPLTIVASLGVVCLFQAGQKIRYREPLADEFSHIFTFGMAPERYRYSEQLFIEHNTVQWIISDPLAYVGERMIMKGYSVERIDLYLTAESTIDEVRYLKQYIKEHQLSASNTIVLVSSEYHLGRIRLLCERLHLDSEVTLNYVSIPDEFLDREPLEDYWSCWWNYSNLRKEAFNYMMTLLIYWR